MGTRPGTLISTFIFASWVILISGTEQHSKELPNHFEESDLNPWMETVSSELYNIQCCLHVNVDDFYNKPKNSQRSMLKTINCINKY